MAEELPTTTSIPAAPQPTPSPIPQPPQQPQQPEEHPPPPSLTAPMPSALINHQPDTEMAEAAPSPVPHPVSTTSTPAPPQRTATPSRNINGNGEVAPAMPLKASSHGAPARRYLNERVTGVLLEGMKRLAAEQPEDPLRVLGEYLLQRSKELEGT